MAYGTPTNPVAGTVITVAYATVNILDPIRWLRQMTGNTDPPGTGYVVTSDSTTATSWKTGLTAILGVLGYTPANAAGQAFGGAISATGVTSSGALVVAGDGTFGGDVYLGTGDSIVFFQENGPKVLLTATGGYAILVASNTLEIQTDRDVAFHNSAASAGDYSFKVNTATHLATFQGAINAASAALAGALTAASATLSGALSAASAAISGNATVGGTLGVTGTLTGSTINGTTDVQKNGTSVVNRAIHTGTQLAATISDFSTAVLALASAIGHTHSNPANMGVVVSGSYSGNGSYPRTISGLAITPKLVITQQVTGTTKMGFLLGHDSFTLLSGAFPGANAGSGLAAGQFTIASGSGLNDSGQTYNYVAIG